MRAVAIAALFLCSCAVTIEAIERAFDRALPMSGSVDCADAERLRDDLCDLSRQTCAKAEGAKDDAELAAKCADGQRRCERARVRLEERCARGMVHDGGGRQ